MVDLFAWNCQMVDWFAGAPDSCLKWSDGGFVLPGIIRWWICFAWNCQMADCFAWNYQGCICPSLPEHFLLVRKCTCWICAVELKVFPELLHGLDGRQLTSTGIQVMIQRTVWTSCHGNAHMHHSFLMLCGVVQNVHNTAEQERQQRRQGTSIEQMRWCTSVWIWSTI